MRSNQIVHAIIASAVVILAGAVASFAAGQQREAGPEMMRRGSELLDRLERSANTNIVVYGDSLTAGMGTDGTHTFARMVIDHLRHRFPDVTFEQTIAGNAGWTTADALRGFDRQVIPADPDLLIVQFGGNDRGWGRSLQQFRNGFAGLLERAHRETDALVLACLPPFAEEIEDSTWTLAAREVAAEAGIPAACFHRAIREGPHDFRGSFPYGSHPGSFTHVLMAREVMRSFDAAMGAPRLLQAEIVRGESLDSDAEQVIDVTITTLADEAVQWQARLEFGRQVRELEGTATPGELVTQSERFEIPDDLPDGRTCSIPVRLSARSDTCGAFDVAWLWVAPAIVSQPGNEPGTWHELGREELMFGRQYWQGREDLSARFRVSHTEDHLRIEVEVTDDHITVADLNDPSRGDSVEIYLDLRGSEEQGRPLYTEDVLAIQVLAPEDPDAPVRWRNMHDLPADLSDIEVATRSRDGGYDVVVGVPLAAIEAIRGGDWGGIGLDVGVNDADFGERKTQIMWRGIADNYLNPAYLAGVYQIDADRATLPDGATRRIVR